MKQLKALKLNVIVQQTLNIWWKAAYKIKIKHVYSVKDRGQQAFLFFLAGTLTGSLS